MAKTPLPAQGSQAWYPWATDIDTAAGAVLNVKHYGAAGNGSTDDTAAVTAALAGVTAAAGGVLLFPPGTYLITAALSLPSNVILRGAGSRVSTLRVGAGATGSRLLDATGGQAGITLEHLGFDGQSNTTMYKCLETGGTTAQQRIKVTDCYLANWRVPPAWDQTQPDIAAILLWSSVTSVAQVLIERSEFVNCAKGVRCYYATDSVVIRGNRFSNSAVKGMQAAVELVGASPVKSGALVEGNTIDGANWDPSGDPGGQLGCGIVTGGARGVRIIGNKILNCGDPASQQVSSGGVGPRASLGGGILVSQDSQGAKVIGNEVHDCQQHGIYMEVTELGADTTVGAGGVYRGATVQGNHVWNITGVGNAASATSRATITGININYAAGTTVVGNVVHDTAHPGIATDSDRCVIADNVVYNTWQAVIPATAPTLGTTTGTLPAGQYTVAYSYLFDSTKGQESIISPTASVTVSGTQGITVGALTGIPAGVTAVKFYITATTAAATTGSTGVTATVTAGATPGATVNAQGNGVPAADYAASKGGIVVGFGGHTIVAGNQVFDNQTVKTTKYGVAFGNSNSHRALGNDFTGVATSGVFMFGGGTTNYLAQNGGYNPVGVLGPPAVPATGVAYTNTYGVDAMVTVTGGTVTSISVGGTTTGLTSGAFRVPQGQTITIAYSVTPTWKWFGD